ncbi:MAG: hypothetical protein GPJ51_15110 [Candidatus Heimdallarchaeota archaeon]|nr:hypothetical protein [Candidatus Heimdallarchaeota archaeon]
MQNLEVISNKIFKYYPKRRKLFINRLVKQASVQNILTNNKNIYIGTTGSGHSYSIDASKLRELLATVILEKDEYQNSISA